jgi:hypothetical protein
VTVSAASERPPSVVPPAKHGSGGLAATGLPAGLAAIGLVLLLAAVRLRRRVS